MGLLPRDILQVDWQSLAFFYNCICHFEWTNMCSFTRIIIITYYFKIAVDNYLGDKIDQFPSLFAIYCLLNFLAPANCHIFLEFIFSKKKRKKSSANNQHSCMKYRTHHWIFRRILDLVFGINVMRLNDADTSCHLDYFCVKTLWFICSPFTMKVIAPRTICDSFIEIKKRLFIFFFFVFVVWFGDSFCVDCIRNGSNSTNCWYGCTLCTCWNAWASFNKSPTVFSILIWPWHYDRSAIWNYLNRSQPKLSWCTRFSYQPITVIPG